MDAKNVIPIYLSRRFLTAAQGLQYRHFSNLKEKISSKRGQQFQLNFVSSLLPNRAVPFCFLETIHMNIILKLKLTLTNIDHPDSPTKTIQTVDVSDNTQLLEFVWN